MRPPYPPILLNPWAVTPKAVMRFAHTCLLIHPSHNTRPRPFVAKTSYIRRPSIAHARVYRIVVILALSTLSKQIPEIIATILSYILHSFCL